jgi:hypothetical protein
MEFLTILPNLSIGVISVLSLVYITLNFLKHLDERTVRHEHSMKEREDALRHVESEVRNNILAQLSKNTEILNDTSKTLSRVMQFLDNK